LDQLKKDVFAEQDSLRKLRIYERMLKLSSAQISQTQEDILQHISPEDPRALLLGKDALNKSDSGRINFPIMDKRELG
jgi:hypothetical protein